MLETRFCMAFCPKCGKDAVDVFCEECLREGKPLIEGVKPITLTKCSVCDRIKISGVWQRSKEFSRLVKKSVQYTKGTQILDTDFPIPVIEEDVKEFELPFAVLGTVSKQLSPYEEEYAIPITVEKEQCDRCGMAKSGYFEGTLQIRNPRPEVISYIEKKIQEDDEVLVTKATDVRGGIDFQVTNQQFLSIFVHELRKRFGGEVKIDAKLHTYDAQRSKKVYRLTALLRLPKFGRGDIIETGKRLMRVTRMGSTVHGFDLRRRKPTATPCPKEGTYILHEPIQTVVSSTRPNLTVIDPDDYQELPLAHQAPVEPGQKVKIIVDSRDKWYIAEKVEGEGSS